MYLRLKCWSVHREITWAGGTDHAVSTVTPAALHCAVPLHRLWLIGRRQSVLGPLASICLQKVAGDQVNSIFPTKPNHTVHSLHSLACGFLSGPTDYLHLLDTLAYLLSPAFSSSVLAHLARCLHTANQTKWVNHGASSIGSATVLFDMMC